MIPGTLIPCSPKRTDTDAINTNMEHTVHHSPNGAGHEQSEVSVRLIVVSLAFLAVATAFVFVLVVGIFRYFYDTYSTAEATRLSQPVIPPEPRIEVAPYEQLQQLRAKEDHVLNSYAWVDKEAGVVRVPIDHAIDLLAAKGLPSHNYLDDILAGRKAPRGRPRRRSLRNKELAMRSNGFLIAGMVAAAFSGVAAAQQMGIPAASLPMMVQGVGIDQNLNAQIPLELKFKDETGQDCSPGPVFPREARGAGAGLLRLPRPVRFDPERPQPRHGADLLKRGHGLRGSDGELQSQRELATGHREKSQLHRKVSAHGRPGGRKPAGIS